MATHIPQPVILEYSETNIGKYASVRHYECTSENLDKTPLTQKLNLSKDRKCAKSSPIYWLQTHNGKNWIKPRLTGLFSTSKSQAYSGDVAIKKVKTHTLVFQFSNEMQRLKVLYFHKYHTKDIREVLHFLTA